MLLSRCPGSPQACFVRRHRRVSSHAAASFPDLAPFVEGLEEPSARAMLSRVELLPVTLDDGVVVETAVARCGPRNGKPLVLLAGFDSSLLEYRRLFPLLEAAGVHAVCLDLLGCGLTTAPPGSSNSPAGRRAHLLAFAAQHLHRPMTLLGSSMGGAAAVDFAASEEGGAVATRLILVAPQIYVEGTPSLPGPLAQLGVTVLRANWLRQMAGKMAYADAERFATDDARRIGRFHTHALGWGGAMVDWMASGGYRTASLVPTLRATSTLVVWGEEDGIIPLSPAAAKLMGDLPPPARLLTVPRCGHVPHLEAPAALAAAVVGFLGEEEAV